MNFLTSETSTHFSLFDTRPEHLLLKSSNTELNKFVGGGLQKGMITQIFGEAGSGKTQIAMLFTLGAVMRGIPVAYLSTEKDLSWKRYTELGYSVMNEAEFDARQGNLMLKKSSDFGEGYKFIEDSLKAIKDGGKGGLLVIDTIYQLLTSSFEFHQIDADIFARSRKQAELVNRLRWLGKMSGSAILLINHAADAFQRRRNSSSRLVPALGPSWELHMDESIMIMKKREMRQMSVVHSPKCASGSKSRFRIVAEGLVWISQEGVQYE